MNGRPPVMSASPSIHHDSSDPRSAAPAIRSLTAPLSVPLAVPRSRLGGRRQIEAVPVGPALGAEIRGVDLRHVERRRFRRDPPRLAGPFVLLFRGQTLSDDDLIGFSRRFGDARPGAGPGERAPLRRRPSRALCGLERDRERRRDRQPRRRRGGLAHRHVLPGPPAQGEHALRARGAAVRRQHRLLQHVPRLGRVAGGTKHRVEEGG